MPFLSTVNQRFLISIRMGGLALCTPRVSDSYSTIRTLETHLSCTHHPLPLSANHLNRYRRKKREEKLHLQFTMIQHWHSHVVSVYTCFDVYLCCARMRVCMCVCVCVCVCHLRCPLSCTTGLCKPMLINARVWIPFSLFFPNNTLYSYV